MCMSLSLGPVQMETVEKVKVVITAEEKARQQRMESRPLLDEVRTHSCHFLSPYLYPPGSQSSRL